MAKWLCGSMSGYYAYRGELPCISFSGTSSYGTIPESRVPTTALVCNFDFYLHAVSATLRHGFFGNCNNASGGWGLAYNYSDGKITLFCNTSTNFTIATIPGVAGTRYSGTITITPTNLSITINGSTFSASRTFSAPTVQFTVGRISQGGWTAYSAISVFSLKISVDGVQNSWVEQGDQSASTSLLPSHPAGVEGSLSNTTWKYENVTRHDTTTAAMLTYINSITLTDNITIVDLDTNIADGTFPATKDGFAITVQRVATKIFGMTMDMDMQNYHGGHR